MSSIEKLLVQGIRSFDPQSPNVIEFYTPLTLIVGHNGSGKTTIIECLKYATTGDLPPNSAKGAFIHDPKIAHETEVKAKVSLRFRNCNQQQMTCTRSMSLTQRKAGVTQKTLESLLSTIDPITNERVCVSSRCQELDTEVPIQLGVSKAILENVIFCHQEDSNWPLSEPSILKKKFDEIFSATKYTKALQSIKKLSESQSIELRVDKEKLIAMKKDKERSHTIEREINITEERIQMTTTKIDEIREKKKENDRIINELSAKLAVIEEDKLNISKVQHELDVLERGMGEMREGSLADYTESDEDLLKIISEYKEQLRQSSSAYDQIYEKKRTSQTEEGELRKSLDEKIKERGRLEMEIESFHAAIKNRAILVKKAMSLNPLMEFKNKEISNEDVKNWINAMEEQIRKQKMTLEEEQLAFKEKEDTLSEKFQTLSNNLVSLKEKKKMAHDRIEHLNSNIRRTKSDILKMDISENDIQTLKRKLEEKNADIGRKMDSFNLVAKKKRIEELQELSHEVENQNCKLNEEFKNANRLNEDHTRVRIKEKELVELRLLNQKSLEKLKDAAVSALGSIPSGDMLDNCIEASEREKLASVALLENRLRSLESDNSATNAELKLKKDLLSVKLLELNEKKKTLAEGTNGIDYPQFIKDLEIQLTEKRDNLSQMKAASKVYLKYLSKSKETHQCPLCVRGFSGNDEFSSFLLMLEKTIQSFPNLLSATEKDLHSSSNVYEEKKRLSTYWDDFKRLNEKEIPELQENIKKLEFEKNSANEQIEDMASQLACIKAEAQLIQNLKIQLLEYKKEKKVLMDLEDEVASLKALVTSKSIVRSLHDIKEDLDNIGEKREQVQKELSILKEDINLYQNELQQINHDILLLQEKLHSTELQLAEKKKSEKSIINSQEEIDKLDTEIKAYENELMQVRPDIEVLQLQQQRIREDSRKSRKSNEDILAKLIMDKDQIVSMNEEVIRYQRKELDVCLVDLENSIQSLNNSLNDIHQTLELLTVQGQSIEKQRAELKLIERDVEDVLSYRKMERDYKELQDKKSKIIEHCVSEREESNFRSRLNRCKVTLEEMLQEEAGLFGEIRQMETQVLQKRETLLKEYKDITKLHQEKLVEVKTTEAAHDDLEKYRKALDSAIMKYHSIKMEEINKIIRELWVNTYQGNDIDTIEIRSDYDGTKLTRTYNYRVVIMKDDVELDLRGRCSAGQKVLTSIVIRLALAEVFGLNCGILALDEPTTNLDRANVESLAESLSYIIQHRRQQRNFQLVIITHDEEFMNLLGKSEYADYYWRVFKDENQHSTIERHEIAHS